MFPNLKLALKIRRLTQRNLAIVLRVSPATLSDRLNGVGPELAPHEKTRVAEFLGFDAAWLFEPIRIPASAGWKPREFAILPAFETR
jgi:transcriptional regulator with XRE-family HTH domain